MTREEFFANVQAFKRGEVLQHSDEDAYYNALAIATKMRLAELCGMTDDAAKFEHDLAAALKEHNFKDEVLQAAEAEAQERYKNISMSHGTKWKDHKYIRIENGRYIYEEPKNDEIRKKQQANENWQAYRPGGHYKNDRVEFGKRGTIGNKIDNALNDAFYGKGWSSKQDAGYAAKKAQLDGQKRTEELKNAQTKQEQSVPSKSTPNSSEITKGRQTNVTGSGSGVHVNKEESVETNGPVGSGTAFAEKSANKFLEIILNPADYTEDSAPAVQQFNDESHEGKEWAKEWSYEFANQLNSAFSDYANGGKGNLDKASVAYQQFLRSSVVGSYMQIAELNNIPVDWSNPHGSVINPMNPKEKQGRRIGYEDFIGMVDEDTKNSIVLSAVDEIVQSMAQSFNPNSSNYNSNNENIKDVSKGFCTDLAAALYKKLGVDVDAKSIVDDMFEHYSKNEPHKSNKEIQDTVISWVSNHSGSTSNNSHNAKTEEDYAKAAAEVRQGDHSKENAQAEGYKQYKWQQEQKKKKEEQKQAEAAAEVRQGDHSKENAQAEGYKQYKWQQEQKKKKAAAEVRKGDTSSEDAKRQGEAQQKWKEEQKEKTASDERVARESSESDYKAKSDMEGYEEWKKKNMKHSSDPFILREDFYAAIQDYKQKKA